MILIGFNIKGDKGEAHPEVDEFQTKVDGLLGIFGKVSCEVSDDALFLTVSLILERFNLVESNGAKNVVHSSMSRPSIYFS